LSDLFSNLTRNLKSKLARHLDPPNHKKKPARPRRIPYRRTNSIATTLTSPTGSTASATSNHLYNAAPAPTPQVYQKDKKRTKELEAELETYNRNIADLTKRADQIRSNPGPNSAEVTQKLQAAKLPLTLFPNPFTLSASISSSASASISSPTATRMRKKPKSIRSSTKRRPLSQQELPPVRDDDTRSVSARLNDAVVLLNGAQEPVPAKLEQIAAMTRIFKNASDIASHHPFEALVDCLRLCLADPVREIRTAGFRALRHLVTDEDDVRLVMRRNLDIFIVRALARDQHHEAEREQALKLVRAFVEHGGVSYVTQGIMRAVVAIAEQSDDKLRNICLETIAEI
ncbi:Rapamycin-insensitive companion of mTOR, N-term-domain-containing protein, partial [Jimgerdemannia flammicorona]